MSLHNIEGFYDVHAAKRVLQRLRLRTQLLKVEALIPTLLHALDHPVDANGDAIAPCTERGVALASSDVEGRVGREPVHGIECDDVGEQELLQGVDLVLQFLDTLLHRLGHGQFSLSTMPEAIEFDPAAQPIDAGAK